jgi:hypothetical protein
MEEDLAMYGNQLVTSTSIWTVGYVIGQIPSNLLLTRVSPRWVIPAVCVYLPSFLSLVVDRKLLARAWLGRCDFLHVGREVLQSTLRFTFPRWVVRVSRNLTLSR